MKKARIIERTQPDGCIKYVIQQKHFIFRWLWVDVHINWEYCQDSFGLFEEAKGHLPYFDGTKNKDKIKIK
jgi:hypothetical protein